MSPYEVLGVGEDATDEQIRARWRELLGKLHPDRGGDPATFRVVKAAYEQIDTAEKRAAIGRARATAPQLSPLDLARELRGSVVQKLDEGIAVLEAIERLFR